MIYLDNAATAYLRPPKVLQAMTQALGDFGNAARGTHGPAMDSMRCLHLTRTALATLMGVQDPARVVFFPNATTALNTLIYALPGHVVTTAAEHNSVLRPLHRRGNYSVMPLDASGNFDIVVNLGAAITPETKAIVISHASGVTGNVYDLREISAFCRRRGLILIVDAAQTAGLLPIQVDELGISAVCFSGHKALMGPQGTGGMCLGPDFLPDPTIIGGTGGDSFNPNFADAPPERYEAGTQNAHGIAGLLAGIEYVQAEGSALFQRADMLARRFARRMTRIGGIKLYGDLQAKVRAPIVSLNLPRMDCATLAASLWEKYEIAIRPGIHCAPLMHQALGTAETGAARFSFSGMNTVEEVDAAASAVASLAGGHRRRLL